MRLLLGNQGVVGSFAGQTGCSSSVIRSCQLSRSRISPAEQVGEHHGGLSGCFAWLGIAGMAGALICSCCQAAGLLVQPSSNVTVHRDGVDSTNSSGNG